MSLDETILPLKERFLDKSTTVQNAYLHGYMLSTTDYFKCRSLYESGDLDENITRYGIFNPSVARTKDTLDIIYRAEPSDTTWGGHFLDQKAVALLGKLQINGDRVDKVSEPTPVTGGTTMASRPEDWRLFKGLDGKLYTNLTNYCYFNEGWPQERVRSATCIARVRDHRFELLQELDASAFLDHNAEEKNWLIFTHKGKYYCLYGLEPYVLFEMDKQFRLTRVAAREERTFPRFCDNYLANSTNPVYTTHPRFGKHYLLFSHNFTHPTGNNKRNRTYWHYAVVIDYDTLKPVGFTPYPVLGGGGRTGRHDNIMYVSGLSVYRQFVYVFYGEGDEHSQYCVIPKKTLYKNIHRL
tara:strand:- start:1805 stop:2866 length:1062 start_codon:yes stop_codon:yes gene_type:complete